MTPPQDGKSDAVVASYAEIDFSSRPSYLPNNVVNLTFDDGPDWNNTARVLDVLREKNAKASFFINTENWSSVSMDQPMQALVRRIVDEGHELASHSVHHLHMATLAPDAIEAELKGVEDTVRSIIGSGAPRMTLFRAPFGEPYQGNDPNWPSGGYNVMAPIVARHAVHIGWGIDSFDYNCGPGDGACVANNVKGRLSGGDYGVILMHSVHASTANGLPEIIDYIRANGYQLWTTEQVVRARFGRSSAEIVDGGGGGDDGSSDDGSGDDGSGDDGSSDDGGGDDGSGDDGSSDDGSGDDGSGDDGSSDDGGDGGDCDAPGFVAGSAYSAGDQVVVGGTLYECKPWPFSGWCSAGGAFAPGTGWAWDMAWIEVGACSGGDDGSSDDGSSDDGSSDDGSSDDGSSDDGSSDDGSSDDGGGDDSSDDDGSDGGDGDGDWREARLTYFTSYPDPGSEECIEFNGCMWSGYFAAFDDRKSEEWVSQHNLVAVHERDFDQYVFKTLRIRSGDHEIEAQVVDMCADSDCDGCCTRNAAATGFLLDLESYTAERFGVWDADSVEWMCIDC